MLALILASVVALVSGASYQACCAGWVHYSERGRAWPAAGFGMLEALATVAGIGESVHDLRTAPFFVFGYGIGSFVAVKVKARFT